MEIANLTELRFEAPLASFDLDEWNEFADELSYECVMNDANVPNIENFKLDDFDSENLSGSLEDLVNTFDTKIIKCFKNYDVQAQTIAPVQHRSEEDVLSESQNWWTLSGDFGSTLPIDWTRAMPISQSNESDFKQDTRDSAIWDSDENSDNFDDEHIRDQTMDDECPVISAEQVINEINQMLEARSPMHKPHRYYGSKLLSRLLSSNLVNEDKMADRNTNNDEELRKLSFPELLDLKHQLNSSIVELSEILVKELDMRDELEFEKELKSQFIWLLIVIQKKRKEALQHESVKPNGYLTTVIPYKDSGSCPSMETLQIYIRILSAINDNSSSTPSLLTDYILHVLCPTSA